MSPKREVLRTGYLDVIAGGHKVLIANYLRHGLRIQILRQAGISGGDRRDHDRETLICKNFKMTINTGNLMTLKTGGIGLNLTAWLRVYFRSPGR